MSSLPQPPSRFEYEDLTVVHVAMTAGDPSRGLVPGYHFRLFDRDSTDVGHINYRVGDSEHVRLAAGHIGYEVKPEYRGCGYARKACMALAPWLAEVTGKVLINVDPDNLPSIRTVGRIGAVFLDEVAVPKGDPHFVRGSRRKHRFEWDPGRSASRLRRENG